MSDSSTIDAPKLQETPPTSAAEDLMREIEKIPREYWPNLLQMIRLFRESVALKPASQQDAWQKVVDEIKNPDPVETAARQKALSELLRSWREEGDEQEQKETWEIIRKALEEDPVSI